MFVLLALLGIAALPSVSQDASAPVPARVTALAKEWYRRLESAEVDRTQLDDALNAELTDQMIRDESAKLEPLGNPMDFSFVSAQAHDQVAQYDYRVTLASGRFVLESIAFDSTGKIDGLGFRIFTPR